MALFSLLVAVFTLAAVGPAARAAPVDLLPAVDGELEYRGTRVTEIEFEGDRLSDLLRSRFESLKGRAFQPTSLRAVLLWAHENGGDFLIQVGAGEGKGGLKLVVTTHRKKKITAVEFEGNVAMIDSALEPIVELKEGAEFEPDTVAAAAQRLTLYYSKQGYLATEIKHNFDSTTGKLVFHIKEGEPTLLHSFGLSPITSVERKDLRRRYERDLTEAFGLKIGDRIQRERVLEGIQGVKDWLRDHDFLMAKDPAMEYRVDENGKVGLFLNIDYGPRIRFGFRGNTQFSYRELMVLVGEVKEVASGNEYLAAVRRRILDAYKEMGLANAQINTLVREDPARGIRYVSLLIEEGEKIRIDQVTIEGVYSMDQDEAVKEFKASATRLVQRDFFDEEGVNKAASLFAEKLQARGFLNAKLEYMKLDFNPKRTHVSISLLYTEGVQTRVQDIQFTGINSFTHDEVMKILGLKVGEPFDIFSFEKGLNTLKDAYQDAGRLSAQVVNEASEEIVKYSKDNSEVSIHVEVDEGPTFNVGDILVRGNQKTHSRVILREMPFITGDMLTAPLLAEAEANLRKLNIFSSVIIRPIDRPGADNVKDILILVEESAPGYFEVLPGYRNDLGARLGFNLGYQNIGGWNRTVSLDSAVSRRFGSDYKFPEYLFSLGYKEPFLGNWPVTFTSNLSLFKREYPSFDADIRRILLGLKRDLTSYLSVFLEYDFELNKIMNVQAPYSIDDQRTDLIGSFTPGFAIDSRDDRFNPAKGIFSTNRFEVASHNFGSSADVGFYRFTSFNSTYIRLYDRIVLALAANLGWERSNVVGAAIPIYRLFRTGGINSIRGYAEDEIEVDTTKNITGSLSLVNYRAEVRIPIVGNFGTAIFLDAGNLIVDTKFFSALNPNLLLSSVGAGLRYSTPVGPVLLDFAWRLQSDNATLATDLADRTGVPTDRYRIHFAIGVF